MSLYGIFSSPSQRSRFFFTSILIITFFIALILFVHYCMPDTRVWALVINILVALVSSGVFALLAVLYIRLFFDDPNEASLTKKILPKDLGPAIRDMAANASEYKVFVRTGRHFRAEVLPILSKNARVNRRAVTIEAILLDFRNDDVCEKYASYRRSTSFDSEKWTKKYVQVEILATILKLIRAAHDHSSIVKYNLYLTTRLSTFRFDGSQNQIIITREDPKDIASRYVSFDDEFFAYTNEFDWAREEACAVDAGVVTDTPLGALKNMFGNCPIIAELEMDIANATKSPSPYVR